VVFVPANNNMPAEVYSLHGSGQAGLASSKPAEKRALKYTKGLKRPKDEKCPKKPLTGYFSWANENRERVKAELNTTTLAEITKKLGEMWRELPKNEKSKYDDEYKKKLEVWKKLQTAYKMTSEYQEFGKSLREFNIRMTHKPFKKDENMPKRSLSAYMLFAGDERPKVVKKNRDAKVTEVMGLIAKAWKDLSEEAKAPYNKKAKTAADKHHREIGKYKQSEDHKKYLAEKKAYEDKMTTKRKRLEKLSVDALEGEDMGDDANMKGSGVSPKAKRKTSAPKKKKTSDPKKKKKKSDPKNKVQAKKKKSDPKKKRSKPKKTSEPKKKKASEPKKKKKTSEPKNKKSENWNKKVPKQKTSAKKKARKAVAKKSRGSKK